MDTSSNPSIWSKLPKNLKLGRDVIVLGFANGYFSRLLFYFCRKVPENLFGEAQKDTSVWGRFSDDLLEQVSTRQNWLGKDFFLQIVSWDDIPSFLYPVLSYIGPYIASQHTVAVKLLRLLTKFFDEEKDKVVKNSRGGIFLMANVRSDF